MSDLNKTIHIIWVGDEGKRPDAYIKTWRDMNPGWVIKVWGNKEYSEYPWVLKHQLHYRWHVVNELNGVADIMRWEVLYNEGGFGVDADGPCIRPLDDWLFSGTRMAACLESEYALPGRLATGYIYAEKAHPLVRAVIDGIQNQPQCDLLAAWRALATMRLTYEFHKSRPSDEEFRVWPSHYFIPEHRWAPPYQGVGPVFAKQMFMTTHSSYKGTTEYNPEQDLYLFAMPSEARGGNRSDDFSSLSHLTRDEAIAAAFKLHQKGNLAEAESLYRQWLLRAEGDFVALHMLGVVRYQRGDLAEAEELLQTAININNLTPQAHFNLGNVFLAKGQIEAARSCFLRALELDEGFSLAMEQLEKTNLFS